MSQPTYTYSKFWVFELLVLERNKITVIDHNGSSTLECRGLHPFKSQKLHRVELDT